MGEPVDVEDVARREQFAVDVWDDGERVLAKIAAHPNVRLSIAGVRTVLEARGLISLETSDTDGERLPELRIADIAAEHLGKSFVFDVEIVATEDPMSIPTRVVSTCLKCGTPLTVQVDPRQYALSAAKERRSMVEPLQCYEEQGGCKRFVSATKFRIDWEESESVDYTRLVVSDFSDEVRFSETQEDLRVPLHLIGLRAPRGARIRVRGMVLRENLETQKFVIVAEGFRELEWRPAAPKMDAELAKAFTEIGRMSMEKKRLQIAPDMVGRPLVQEAILRTEFSVMRIPDVNGKEIRGVLNVADVGDTKTNKSDAARDAADSLHCPFIQAENAARTGITHTIDPERRVLYWGVLPRHHGMLAVIDGLEKWTQEMQGDIRAVMNDLEVRVDKMVHGRHATAVRMILTLNPKKTDMGQYPFRCAAIPDTKPFPNGPDISRVDIWITSARADVPKEQIANRQGAERPIDAKRFLEFVHWAWSRKSSQVSYTPTAAAKIRETAAWFMREYGAASIPVVHDGFMDVLCRVSVSDAALSFSTTDGENVVVTDENVERAAAFLTSMCDALELKPYRLAAEEGAMLTGGDFLAVSDRIEKDGRAIVNLLANHLNESMTAKEIAKALNGDGGEGAGWTEQIVVDRYGDLKDEELIETTRGKGVVLTPRGMAYFNLYRTMDELFRRKSGGTPELPPKDGRNKSGGTPGEIDGWAAGGSL